MRRRADGAGSNWAGLIAVCAGVSLAACSSTTGTAPTDDGGATNDGTADALDNGSSPADGASGSDASDGSKMGDATLDAEGTAPGDSGLNMPSDATSSAETGAADAQSTVPEASASDASADAEPSTDAHSSTDARATVDASGSDASGSDASGSTLTCGAAPCATGETLCNGACVSNSDPAFGCGSCTACSTPHATATCGSGGACAVATCEPGWADSDGDPSNGCEVDTTSPSTCTSAGLVCSGGTQLCAATGCVATCTPPLTTCGSRCISLTASASHCGGCNTVCTPPTGGFATCTNQGTCGTSSCPTGEIVCNGQCVNPQTDGSNCGNCGNTCPAVTNAAQTCSGGSCAAVCPPGWSMCSNACTQVETDPNNCGSCGHACGAGMACVDNACQSTTSLWLATGLSGPTDLTTDALNVYWVDPGNQTVNAVAKTGGTVNVLATSQPEPMGIAVDDTYVYWADNLGGGLFRTMKTGGDTAHIVATVTSPTGIAINDTYVYTIDGNGAIERALKAEGATATVFAAPAAETYTNLTLDGDALYVLNKNLGGIGYSLLQIDSTTGTVLQNALLGEIHGPQALAVTGDIVAVSAFPPSEIEWLNLVTNAQGSTGPGVFTFSPSPVAIASCGIVTDESGEGLLVIPYGAAVPTLLLASASPTEMVVDGHVVYWTDSSGAIGALPLP